MDDYIFVLDIGTRVVMGLVMSKKEDVYHIQASARSEHKLRSMYDGQIHDVEKVAHEVRKIKQELEEKTSLCLDRVAVAAAGRALLTQTSYATREELLPLLWEKSDQVSLEMEAVQRAMRVVSSEARSQDQNYYCVGYSTIQQELDGLDLENIIGQRGKRADIRVVATFLPRLVVDGLMSVLTLAGLELAGLTLEPIAAGMAAIPTDMRRLNLALVDVGAGTSDIALTKNGGFFAFGMVPVAGDEITEAVCSDYLLDFAVGEELKRSLDGKIKTVENFFGEKVTLTQQQLLGTIAPVVTDLSERIAKEIQMLNGGAPPQAVILVGGGVAKNLPEVLGSVLQIPVERVGVQMRERLKRVQGDESVTGSDVITALGIGMAHFESRTLRYYSVKVNGVMISIFELQMVSVAEALLAAGIQPRLFLGRPGAALVFTFNGDMKIIKGDMGTNARVIVNGQEARLEEKIAPGDEIEFSPGVNGSDAKIRLHDVIFLNKPKKIWYNGREEVFVPRVRLNGEWMESDEVNEWEVWEEGVQWDQWVGLDRWIADGDIIETFANDTLEDLLQRKGLSVCVPNTVHVYVDGEEKVFRPRRDVLLNGEIVMSDRAVMDGDRVDVHYEDLLLRDLDLKAEPMSMYLNNRRFSLKPKQTRFFSEGAELKEMDPVDEGMALSVRGFVEGPILSDLIPYVPDIHAHAVSGGSSLRLEINDQAAGFTSKIREGDRIFIEWVK
ncbi:MAG: ATPase [Peptococcaceae bacterium]|nr:ATPase [Peptococcaceae bacterium]